MDTVGRRGAEARRAAIRSEAEGKNLEAESCFTQHGKFGSLRTLNVNGHEMAEFCGTHYHVEGICANMDSTPGQGSSPRTAAGWKTRKIGPTSQETEASKQVKLPLKVESCALPILLYTSVN